MTRLAIIAVALLAGVQCSPRGQAPREAVEDVDQSVWVVDRNDPGPDEPPAGCSLFDELFSTVVDGERIYDIPFPFQTLTARIAEQLNSERGEYVQQVLIPIGRSLQATRNRPDYFASPRVVVAVDGEAGGGPGSRLFLKDRLFLGYQAKGAIIEVISYNEQAGRFEFQIVSDYQEGGERRVEPAHRGTCITCHHGLAPIFPRPLWNETNANEDIRELLAERASEFFGVRVRGGVDVPGFIDDATDRASLFAAHQMLWAQGCEDARCRADALLAMLAYRLRGRRHSEGAEQQRFAAALAASWSKQWPGGLKIPNPDIPDRDVIGNFRRASERAQQPGLVDRVGSIEFARFVDSAFGAEDFNPVTPRKPIAVWHADGVDIRFAREVIAGLAGFFSQADIRQIREALPELDGDESRADDFPHLRDAIEELVRTGSDGLAAKPLRPSTVVPELIARLSKTLHAQVRYRKN